MPSRSTVALMVTWARSFSTALLAAYSWAKLSTALATTMTTTIAASVHSPAMADTTAAKMRISTSGLVNWRRKLQRGVTPAWLQDVWPHLPQSLLGLGCA